MSDIFIGEAFVGEVPDNAHPNVMVGPKATLAAVAAQAIASPSAGFVPFFAVLRPNVMVRPATLFVPKVAVEPGLHAELTWGPVQAGVALGVFDAWQAGIFPSAAIDDWLVIAAIWVNRAARDGGALLANHRAAMQAALASAFAGGPSLEEMTAAALQPENPFLAGKPTQPDPASAMLADWASRLRSETPPVIPTPARR